MSETLVIEGRFPSLNDYIREINRSRWAGAAVKRDETARVRDAALLAHMARHAEKVDVHIHWVEHDTRRDPDNIRFAVKFILDGLVAAGVIRDDNQGCIGRIQDTFDTDREHPRVEITLTPSETRSKDD